MAKRHPRKAQVVFRVIRNRNQTNGTTLSFSFCEIDRITIKKKEETKRERERVVSVLNHNNKTKALVEGNLPNRRPSILIIVLIMKDILHNFNVF